MKRKLILLVLVSVAIVAGFIIYTKMDAYEGTISPRQDIVEADARAVYVGAWVENFWDSRSKKLRTETLTKFQETIGKKMAIANIYSEWTYLENKDLLGNLNSISSQGWTPMISSNPFFFEKCKDIGKSLYRTIADGDCDDFLESAARNLKTYSKPVMFRFAWEMNLPDMYWSVPKVGSEPSDFIEAWRRMYNIFAAQNADNVLWVLSFNTSHSTTVPYKDLYPGDEYVDWVAIDGYNWGNSHEWSGWASFDGTFRKSYDELTAITSKPVMLSEVNSAPQGGDKTKWLEDMLNEQIPNHYPQVEAIIFFNENKAAGEKVDWRIEKDKRYIKAVNEGLSDEMYKSHFP